MRTGHARRIRRGINLAHLPHRLRLIEMHRPGALSDTLTRRAFMRVWGR